MSIQNIVFLAKNFSELSGLLTTFGFEECFHKTDASIRLYRQQKLSITVKIAETLSEQDLVACHGTFIQEAWLHSKTSKHLNIDDLGVILRCVTSEEMNTLDECFSSPKIRRAPSLLSHLDHIAINIEASSLETISKKLMNKFDFTPLNPQHIQGSKTSFTCSAFQFKNEDVFIVLNTSHDPKSQIQTFIDRHKGPGVQHLAFHTKTLERCIPIFKKQGIPFIDVPEAYYDELEKTGVSKMDCYDLQEASLLLEESPLYDGHLKQTFTKDLVGPIFFEFISRDNLNGFGEKNITALFKAVESSEL